MSCFIQTVQNSNIFCLQWYKTEKSRKSSYLRGWKQLFCQLCFKNDFSDQNSYWLFFSATFICSSFKAERLFVVTFPPESRLFILNLHSHLIFFFYFDPQMEACGEPLHRGESCHHQPLELAPGPHLGLGVPHPTADRHLQTDPRQQGQRLAVVLDTSGCVFEYQLV